MEEAHTTHDTFTSHVASSARPSTCRHELVDVYSESNRANLNQSTVRVLEGHEKAPSSMREYCLRLHLLSSDVGFGGHSHYLKGLPRFSHHSYADLTSILAEICTLKSDCFLTGPRHYTLMCNAMCRIESVEIRRELLEAFRRMEVLFRSWCDMKKRTFITEYHVAHLLAWSIRKLNLHYCRCFLNGGSMIPSAAVTFARKVFFI